MIVVRALVLAVLALSCSSIPEVHYVDDGLDDAGTDAREGDASTTSDAGFSCPANPPPRERGMCCNQNVLCLGCANNGDCNACRRAGCTTGQTCCKGASGLECRASTACE